MTAALPAALATAALPAAAQAAEVTLDGTQIVVADNGGRFGLGTEDNRLIVEAVPAGELRLTDQVPLVVKTSTCLPVSSLEVRCVRPSNSPISRLVYNARAGDDQLRPAGSLPIRFNGGDGQDLYVGARSGAGTRVEFVGGNDGGDPGDADLAHYTNATTAVEVNKDGVANDGRPGLDRDNIDADVDIVTGTHFDDRLVGSNRPGIVLAEEFRPRGGDDVVVSTAGVLTTVDMGAAKDGADKILGASGTVVDYSGRTNPIRAKVDGDGADDGEAGEGDELVDVGVIGGRGDDLMLADPPPDGSGAFFNGGPGDDGLGGTVRGDRLIGGPGEDVLSPGSGDDTLISNDGQPDRLFCSFGNDTAETDAVETAVRDCETRTVVGKLDLTPKAVKAKAGKPAHVRLSWRHPVSWRKLRATELRLTRDELPVGEISIRPQAERITADGAVALVRKHTALVHKGRTVVARLALRADGLAGQTLQAEVEATDKRGRRQLERDVGTVRVAG